MQQQINLCQTIQPHPSQKKLSVVRRHVVSAVVDQRALRRRMAKEHEIAQLWDKKVALATRAGNGDLARLAAIRRDRHVQEIGLFREHLTARDAAVERMKNILMEAGHEVDLARKNHLENKENRTRKMSPSVAHPGRSER